MNRPEALLSLLVNPSNQNFDASVDRLRTSQGDVTVRHETSDKATPNEPATSKDTHNTINSRQAVICIASSLVIFMNNSGSSSPLRSRE